MTSIYKEIFNYIGLILFGMVVTYGILYRIYQPWFPVVDGFLYSIDVGIYRIRRRLDPSLPERIFVVYQSID